MTKNEGAAAKAQAEAVARYLAELNSTTFLPPAHAPRRTGRTRTQRHNKRRAIR